MLTNPILTALLGLFYTHVAFADSLVPVKFGTTSATYVGKTINDIDHFQNVKYGQDTTVVRRFAPPEPFVPEHKEIVDATEPGPACPQMPAAFPPFFDAYDVEENMSEDCLNLRISRPSGTLSSAKLPVVVMVNGGGVVKGWAHDKHADPEKMIQLSVEIGKPIIFVAFEYRLGIFGFARLDVLAEKKSQNVGILDQKMAFRWIKDRIGFFGGDPDRITVFGESAGGTMSTLHLMSEGGENAVPFNQIWAMSGPPGTALNMTTDAVRKHTLAVGARVGCDMDEVGVKQDSWALICLRSVPMPKLLTAAVEYSQEFHAPAGLFTFIPSVDEEVLTDRPSALYKAGKFVKGIPMVLGWTQDDGDTLIAPASQITTEDDIITEIKRYATFLTESDYATLFSLYPVSDFEQDVASYKAQKGYLDSSVPVHFYRASRIIRDMLFTCTSIDFAYEMNRQTDGEFAGVRLYDLNQTMLTKVLKAGGMPYARVAHGSDTNYLFNGLFPEGTVSEEDQKLATEFSTAFINFAYTGNPSGTKDLSDSDWPLAFGGAKGLDSEEELRNVNIHVVGGPHGSGGVSLKKPSAPAMDQQPLGEQPEYAAMGSPGAQKRKVQLDEEKLFERCAFINTLAERLGR